MIAVWMAVPRWDGAHRRVYRRRGADLGDGHPVTVVFRAALILIAVLATADLVRRLAQAHSAARAHECTLSDRPMPCANVDRTRLIAGGGLGRARVRERVRRVPHT